MPPILEGLVPVLLTILLGFALRARGVIQPGHWDGFERVTYHVLIPALVITTLAMADLGRVPVVAVGVALLTPPLAIGLLLFWLRPWLERRLGIDGPAFTSVLQGAIRWNSFVAIALAGALYGREGVTLTAVAFAVLIPLANLMSAYALARHGASPKALTATGLALSLLRNPFIWSTFAGIAIAASGLRLPTPITTFGDILGRSALAAGLLLVGSGLDLNNLRTAGPPLWLAAILKLVAVPMLTGLIAKGMGLNGATLAVPVICAAVPTAAASYILARQNGGDAPLMASIVTAQTLAAAVTMPAILYLLL